MTRVMLIGQAPGRRPGPVLMGRCGLRLATLAGIALDRLPEVFELRNVLDAFPGKRGVGDAFPLSQATFAAKVIKLPDRAILLGRDVARAFGLPHLVALEWVRLGSTDVAMLPHPSGLNRWYNDPQNVERASEFMRSLIATPQTI